MLITPLSGVSGRMIVRGTGDIAGGLTDPIVEQRAVASARARLRAPYPASGPERLGGADLFYEITLPPPDLVIFGAGHDAGPVAQLAWTLGFAVDRRRCARNVPDEGAVRQRDAGVCAFQPVRRARGAAPRQLRADHEPPRRAGPGESSVQPRIGCGLHRRPRASVALRQAAGRPGAAGRTCRIRSRAAARAKPGGTFAGGRDARRSGDVHPGGAARDSTRFRAAGFSAARSAAFTARKTAGSWPARSPRACRYPPADPAETAGPWSAPGGAAERNARRAGAGRARERTRARTDAAAP